MKLERQQDEERKKRAQDRLQLERQQEIERIKRQEERLKLERQQEGQDKPRQEERLQLEQEQEKKRLRATARAAEPGKTASRVISKDPARGAPAAGTRAGEEAISAAARPA